VILGNVIGRLLDGLTLTGAPKQPKPSSGGDSGSGGGGNIQVVSIGTPKIIASDLNHYQAVFKFQVIFPKYEKDSKKIQLAAYAILENGNPEIDPPEGVEIPQILRIELEGNKFATDQPLELDSSMSMKYFEITVSAPQGIGITCRWKLVE